MLWTPPVHWNRRGGRESRSGQRDVDLADAAVHLHPRAARPLVPVDRADDQPFAGVAPAGGDQAGLADAGVDVRRADRLLGQGDAGPRRRRDRPSRRWRSPRWSACRRRGRPAAAGCAARAGSRPRSGPWSLRSAASRRSGSRAGRPAGCRRPAGCCAASSQRPRRLVAGDLDVEVHLAVVPAGDLDLADGEVEVDPAGRSDRDLLVERANDLLRAGGQWPRAARRVSATRSFSWFFSRVPPSCPPLRRES